jgi:hypothetical protein
MAGVPSIMQAMLDEVAPKLNIGVCMLSETMRADVRESRLHCRSRSQAPRHLLENEIPVAKACRGGWSKKRKVPIAGRGGGLGLQNLYFFLQNQL